MRGTDGTNTTDQIPLDSCKDRDQSDRWKAMSNANEIRARSRRSDVAPRYIRLSRVCKSPSAAPSAHNREPTRAHSCELSVLESSPGRASSPVLARNEAAKEVLTRSPSSSRLTAIRMTINDSQHQLERALNRQKQIHTFDTGTVQRCISLRADVELESTHIHTHK